MKNKHPKELTDKELNKYIKLGETEIKEWRNFLKPLYTEMENRIMDK